MKCPPFFVTLLLYLYDYEINIINYDLTQPGQACESMSQTMNEPTTSDAIIILMKWRRIYYNISF